MDKMHLMIQKTSFIHKELYAFYYQMHIPSMKCAFYGWNAFCDMPSHKMQWTKMYWISWIKCISWSTKSLSFLYAKHHYKMHIPSMKCALCGWNSLTCILFTKGVFVVYKIKNTFTLACMKCKTIVHKYSIGFKMLCMKLSVDFSIPLLKCNFLLSFCVHALKYSCIFVSQNSFSLQNWLRLGTP